jgi:coenzyme F420-reducing hydrogenase alpha subunit
MSRGGAPSEQRKRIRDVLDDAFAENASDVVQFVAEQFRPLYDETLARALEAEQLVERCLTVLDDAARHGHEGAREIVNDLLGAGYAPPPRWWQRWCRR